MSETISTQSVANQTSSDASPSPEAASVDGNQTAVIGETQSVQTVAQAENTNGELSLGPQNLPPELEETKKQLLRDYHSKTQKIAEEKRLLQAEVDKFKAYESDANILRQLVVQPWFKKAAEDEKSKRGGQSPALNVSDDELEAVGLSRNALPLLQKLVEQVAESKYGGVLSRHQESLEDIKTDKEFDQAAKLFKDFDELNDKGLLDPYFDNGYDPVAAYKQYKFDAEFTKLSNLKTERIQEEAQNLLSQKKIGSVERPGVTQVRGGRVIRAKGIDDAFDQLFQAIENGEKSLTIEKVK